MVSQVWEGVSRMTALAKQTTQAFLEGSVVLSAPAAGAALPSLKAQCLQSHGRCHVEGMMADIAVSATKSTSHAFMPWALVERTDSGHLPDLYLVCIACRGGCRRARGVSRGGVAVQRGGPRGSRRRGRPAEQRGGGHQRGRL